MPGLDTLIPNLPFSGFMAGNSSGDGKVERGGTGAGTSTVMLARPLALRLCL